MVYVHINWCLLLILGFFLIIENLLLEWSKINRVIILFSGRADISKEQVLVEENFWTNIQI